MNGLPKSEVAELERHFERTIMALIERSSCDLETVAGLIKEWQGDGQGPTIRTPGPKGGEHMKRLVAKHQIILGKLVAASGELIEVTCELQMRQGS